jgi:hypothetical protein
MTGKKKAAAETEHLAWLVESRSANQHASLKLYLLIEKYRTGIADDDYIVVFQTLTAVTFSLWRAVFLADIKLDTRDILADSEAFLRNLIENNAVAYPQDRNARHFSFAYYVSTARHHLSKLVRHYERSQLLSDPTWKAVKEGKITSPTSFWDASHNALGEALNNFERLLSEGRPMERTSTAKGDQ